MTPGQAVEAHSILRAARSVAAHYGTFALADDGETEPEERLRAALQAAPGKPEFAVVAAGEGMEVPALVLR
jgi:L-ascorbate metabolism protein UlaG (beta-lactamase superfamily)